LNHPNDSGDVWEAGDESDKEPDNGNKESESPGQWNVSAAPNVPGLIRPIQLIKKNEENALMTVNIMETRSNMGIKKQ